MPTLPDRNPRVSVILLIAAIGFFALAMIQAGIVFWRLVDMVRGWF